MNNDDHAGNSPGDKEEISNINALYAAIDSSWHAFALYWYGRDGRRSRRMMAGK